MKSQHLIFCNLENWNVLPKLMNKLLTKKSKFTFDTRNFFIRNYESLYYSSKKWEDVCQSEEMFELSFPKQTLSNTEQQHIEVI